MIWTCDVDDRREGYLRKCYTQTGGKRPRGRSRIRIRNDLEIRDFSVILHPCLLKRVKKDDGDDIFDSIFLANINKLLCFPHFYFKLL